MTRFTFNHLSYEVPANIDIRVDVDEEHADYNFVGPDGKDIPMLSGKDEQGEPISSWEEMGIRRIDIHPIEEETIEQSQLRTIKALADRNEHLKREVAWLRATPRQRVVILWREWRKKRRAKTQA